MADKDLAGVDAHRTEEAIPERSGIRVAAAVAVTLLLVFAAHLPVVDFYFNSDDFDMLAHVMSQGFSLEMLSHSRGEHVQPILWGIQASQAYLFGSDPAPYYTFNLIFHLINVYLLFVLVRLLLGNTEIALAVAFLFGLSASHWRVVMWWGALGFSISTIFLQLVLICTLKYLRQGRRFYYGLAIVFHFCQLLTFSYGIETPIALYLITLAFDARFREWKNYKHGLLLIVPFVINLALSLVLQSQLGDPQHRWLDRMGGAAGLVAHLPEALFSVAGGLSEGFFEPLTGRHIFFSAIGKLTSRVEVLYLAYVFVLAAVVVALSLASLREKASVNRFALAAAVGLTGLLIYAMPVLPRLHHGYAWFVSRSRYRYPAGIFIIVALVLLVTGIKYFSNRRTQRAVRGVAFAFLLAVGVSNMLELREHQRFVYDQGLRFETIRARFLADLGVHLRSTPADKIGIIDKSMERSYAGWNAKPSYLTTIYLPEELRSRLEFFHGWDEEWVRKRPLLQPEYGTGKLRPAVPPYDLADIEKTWDGEQCQLPVYSFRLPLTFIRQLRIDVPVRAGERFVVQSVELYVDGQQARKMDLGRVSDWSLVRMKSRGREKCGRLFAATGRGAWFTDKTLHKVDLRNAVEAVLEISAAIPVGRVVSVFWDLGDGYSGKNSASLDARPPVIELPRADRDETPPDGDQGKPGSGDGS